MIQFLIIIYLFFFDSCLFGKWFSKPNKYNKTKVKYITTFLYISEHCMFQIYWLQKNTLIDKT